MIEFIVYYITTFLLQQLYNNHSNRDSKEEFTGFGIVVGSGNTFLARWMIYTPHSRMMKREHTLDKRHLVVLHIFVICRKVDICVFRIKMMDDNAIRHFDDYRAHARGLSLYKNNHWQPMYFY